MNGSIEKCLFWYIATVGFLCRLTACLAPALPCPWDCHVPNTHEVQSSHITSYLPPIYTSPSKLWYPIPFLPFPPYQAARPMPALLGSRI